MTMSGHTPGEWRCNGCEIIGDSRVVATVHWCSGLEAEDKANAALIAAAPALLEALELATKELNAIRARDGAPQHIDWHRGQPLQTDSYTHEWWDELTNKCFAAIALAKQDVEKE